MIRVVCAMLTVAIEDFKLRLNNKNFLMGKSAIQFEPLIQTSKINKYFDLFFFLLKRQPYNIIFQMLIHYCI